MCPGCGVVEFAVDAFGVEPRHRPALNRTGSCSYGFRWIESKAPDAQNEDTTFTHKFDSTASKGKRRAEQKRDASDLRGDSVVVPGVRGDR